MIVQIDKKNSVKSDLTSKRNIHTKAEIPKMFGNIVTTAMKPIVVENLTKFQIGAIPGHRSEEHLFTLKSIAAQAEKNGVALAVELLDLSKYFDKECLIDTMNELYKVKVKGKLYRLVYELNKETKFKVRTPVGESDTREVKETIAQGTSEVGIVSSVCYAKELMISLKPVKKKSRMEIFLFSPQVSKMIYVVYVWIQGQHSMA